MNCCVFNYWYVKKVIYMTMETKDHVIDLIPAYALGSLDYEDEILVSNHLSTCEQCSAELHSYQLVVDELPLSVKESQPPLNLKNKMLSQVSESERDQIDSQVDSWWARFVSGLRKSPSLGLASLVLIFVLGMSSVYLWLEVAELRNSVDTGFVTVSLEGTEITQAASGVVIINQKGDYGTLIVDGLPFQPESQQYQLWLIVNGQRTSGGVFSVNEGGYGSMRIYTKEPLITFSEFGITIEPAGGSEGPTGDKVLSGQS
jgi:anti-sigma-K factor RskA